MATDKELVNKYFSYPASKLRKLKKAGTKQQKRVATTILKWEAEGRKARKTKERSFESKMSEIFGV